MNIEFANNIPISEILSKIGAVPTKTKGHELWYKSPFRNENTGSFHVNIRKNVWFDFGSGEGGDVVKLVCQYLEYSGVQHSPIEALRWLRNMLQTQDDVRLEKIQSNSGKDTPKVILKNVKPLTHPALTHYLSDRGIPLDVAQSYLQEIRVENTETKKVFFALCIQNEEKGYEYRNLYFKGCVGKKSITFIRGEMPKPPAIHIFEGFMDFLSVITQHEGKPMKYDAIILNSLSQMKEAIAYIKGYGYEKTYTWLDNDEAGKKATKAFDEFAKTEPNLKHHPMNKEYAPYKDVNAAHMAKLGL